MSELKLLLWIKNTDDEDFQPSTHSFISAKTEVKDDNEWGRGICAVDQIRRRELLIRIPPSFLLNFTSAVKHMVLCNPGIALPEIYSRIYVPPLKADHKYQHLYARIGLDELLALSSFQILSFYITCEAQTKSSSFWEPFLDMLPPMSDFDLVPLVWHVLKVDQHRELLEALPPSTKDHSMKMIERFETDYKVVTEFVKAKDATMQISVDIFLWAWMCINSRCLYMEMPQAKSNADNFTMAPYVDFLNHSSDDQCSLKIDNLGFQVYSRSDTVYKPGEQLFLSYGPHSNSFLLSEYGFMLHENKWNEIDITAEIEHLLSAQQRLFLDDMNYLGDYTVNVESGPSFRTEVALATLQERTPKTSRKLQAMVNGITDGTIYEAASNVLLSEILHKITYNSRAAVADMRTQHDEPTTALRRKVVLKLYEDIDAIATKYL